jgi:hypothetical protein
VEIRTKEERRKSVDEERRARCEAAEELERQVRLKEEERLAQQRALEEQARVRREELAAQKRAQLDRARQEQLAQWERARKERRSARALNNWRGMMLTHFRKQVAMRNDFKAQFQQTRQEVQAEVQRWRTRIEWRYEEGKAVFTAPTVPLPQTDDEDLRWLWRRPWDQEQARYREEDEGIRRRQELEAQKRQKSTGEWTDEEVWDDLLEKTRLLRGRSDYGGTKERVKLEHRRAELRKEHFARYVPDRRKLPVTISDCEEELSELQDWFQRYKDLDSADKRSQETRRINVTRMLERAKEKQAREEETPQECQARMMALFVRAMKA